MHPLLKFALDYGPLAVFGVTYATRGIFAATAAIMAAVAVAIVIELAVSKKVSPMLGFTGVIVLVLGALTLGFSNEIFIKMKPTILYTIFAGVLVGGLRFGRLFVKLLLGQAFHLPDVAWRTLTWRCAWFFIALAITNEVIWRNTSTNIWVAFKVFGIVPLTILFFLSQVPFLVRHQIESDEAPPAQ
jgi:intracellular septation protein